MISQVHVNKTQPAVCLQSQKQEGHCGIGMIDVNFPAAVTKTVVYNLLIYWRRTLGDISHHHNKLITTSERWTTVFYSYFQTRAEIVNLGNAKRNFRGQMWIFSRSYNSYCNTVWSAIGVILSSVCLSVTLCVFWFSGLVYRAFVESAKAKRLSAPRVRRSVPGPSWQLVPLWAPTPALIMCPPHFRIASDATVKKSRNY